MTNQYRGPCADYSYSVEGSVIAIVDLDQGAKSVTNDMENVLGDLAGYRPGGPAVIYRDSMGRWDGVRLVGRWDGVRLVGRCVEFYSLNKSD